MDRVSKCKLLRQFLKGWPGNPLFCKRIIIVKFFYSILQFGDTCISTTFLNKTKKWQNRVLPPRFLRLLPHFSAGLKERAKARKRLPRLKSGRRFREIGILRETSLSASSLYYELARSCFYDKIFHSNRKATKTAEEIKSKRE